MCRCGDLASAGTLLSSWIANEKAQYLVIHRVIVIVSENITCVTIETIGNTITIL